MTFPRFISVLWLIGAGCAEQVPEPPTSSATIQTNSFAVLETELSPAILAHSMSKYVGLFADTNAPSYIAFATRSGPRSFKNGTKLNAAELEECWLLVWWTNHPPWVVYLQRKPRALTLDGTGLHLSFAQGAGDVVLLPLHGSSTNVDTKKWPEFLTREPLLRIRYWASILREIPIQCESSLTATNRSITIRQRFQFHSIRDDWNTKPLKLAPMSPSLALAADEQLKRRLRELEMPTRFGPYTGLEGVAQWEATFALPSTLDTNCAWASLGTNCVAGTNTSLIHAIDALGWPGVHGVIKPLRDRPAPQPWAIALSRNARLIVYQP